MADFNATFQTTDATFTAEMSSGASEVNAAFGEVIIVDHSWPLYDGPYTVTPDLIEQTLDTERRRTAENITVEAIPYAEVSNPFGTTITIAS